MANLIFPLTYPLTYGYEADLVGGESYKLMSSGVFFWRKTVLFKDGVVCGYYKKNSTSVRGKTLWRDRRNSIYYDGELVSRVYSPILRSLEPGPVYEWECEDLALVWPTVTLLVMSLQAGASSPVSAIP